MAIGDRIRIVTEKEYRIMSSGDGRYPKSAPDYICEACGKNYRPRIYSRRFCSKACQTEGTRQDHCPIKRLYELHIPEPNSGCWLWLGAPGSNGYGVMEIANNKILAHRFSYEHFRGPVPDGKWVLHGCDNRLCVNPDHLHLGDHLLNMAEMKRRKRSLFGHRNPHALLSEAQAITVKNMKGTHQAIADKFGVDRTTITNIKSGKNWSHLK